MARSKTESTPIVKTSRPRIPADNQSHSFNLNNVSANSASQRKAKALVKKAMNNSGMNYNTLKANNKALARCLTRVKAELTFTKDDLTVAQGELVRLTNIEATYNHSIQQRVQTEVQAMLVRVREDIKKATSGFGIGFASLCSTLDFVNENIINEQPSETRDQSVTHSPTIHQQTTVSNITRRSIIPSCGAIGGGVLSSRNRNSMLRKPVLPDFCDVTPLEEMGSIEAPIAFVDEQPVQTYEQNGGLNPLLEMDEPEIRPRSRRRRQSSFHSFSSRTSNEYEDAMSEHKSEHMEDLEENEEDDTVVNSQNTIVDESKKYSLHEPKMERDSEIEEDSLDVSETKGITEVEEPSMLVPSSPIVLEGTFVVKKDPNPVSTEAQAEVNDNIIGDLEDTFICKAVSSRRRQSILPTRSEMRKTFVIAPKIEDNKQLSLVEQIKLNALALRDKNAHATVEKLKPTKICPIAESASEKFDLSTKTRKLLENERELTKANEPSCSKTVVKSLYEPQNVKPLAKCAPMENETKTTDQRLERMQNARRKKIQKIQKNEMRASMNKNEHMQHQSPEVEKEFLPSSYKPNLIHTPVKLPSKSELEISLFYDKADENHMWNRKTGGSPPLRPMSEEIKDQFYKLEEASMSKQIEDVVDETPKTFIRTPKADDLLFEDEDTPIFCARSKTRKIIVSEDDTPKQENCEKLDSPPKHKSPTMHTSPAKRTAPLRESSAPPNKKARTPNKDAKVKAAPKKSSKPPKPPRVIESVKRSLVAKEELHVDDESVPRKENRDSSSKLFSDGSCTSLNDTGSRRARKPVSYKEPSDNIDKLRRPN